MKLNIRSSNKLKIIKVKDWSVSFTYNKEYYLLHIDSDSYEKGATLYKREMCGNSCKGLNDLAGCYCSDEIFGNFIKIDDRGKTYKNIDKDYFIVQLTKHGLIESYYDMDKYIKKRTEINESIEGLRKAIRILEREKRNL